MKQTKLSSFFTLLFSLLFSKIIFAATTSYENILSQDQNAKPSVTFWGLGGDQLIGSGQALIPLGGEGARSLFYAAIEAAGSFKATNGNLAGIAAGYRNIVNNSYLLGGYVFADYNRSPSGHYFWVANPGFEALSKNWDFRVNGYIPTTCKHWLGGEALAENVGITKYEKAFGHERFDHFVQWYEEVGSGLDVEVGRSIPLTKTHNPKIFLGGYHFFMDKTDQITGIEGRIVLPLNQHVALEARDSYDKVRKNVFMAGIRISFGGYNADVKESLGIAGRLSDPIEHDFGNFGAATSIPVGKAYIDDGIEFHLPGAFWYFASSAKGSNSSGDGTIEHPFNAIDLRAYQIMTNSGAYSNNVQMYIAAGAEYNLSGLPGDRLQLLNGYSIYGRTSDFKLAASASLRPILNGGITAFGNNNLSDFVLQSFNNGFGSAGALLLNDAKNVNINDLLINASEKNMDAYGISEIGSSAATINNSVVNVSLITDKGVGTHNSIGIGLLNNSAIFVGSNNYIQASLKSNSDIESHAIGISDTNPESFPGAVLISIFGNNNHIAANSDGHNGRAGGIVVGPGALADEGGHQASNSFLSISGNNNQILANSYGTENKAVGIVVYKSKAEISGSGNEISANSDKSNTIGAMVDAGTLEISGSNNQFNAQSAGHNDGKAESNAGGIIAVNAAHLTISGNANQISAEAAGNNGKAVGIGSFPADPKSGKNNILISGNNNQIRAESANSGSIGIMNDGNLVISGDNNFVFSHALAQGQKAEGIFNFGSSKTSITGKNNKIITISGETLADDFNKN